MVARGGVAVDGKKAGRAMLCPCPPVIDLYGLDYFDVGITNSAPLPMLSGQRCMTLFCLV
jgi:hypothetical protein